MRAMASATSTPPAWSFKRVDEAAVARLTRARDLPELVARLLVLRGHGEPSAAAAHLDAGIASLHDPSLLPGMAAATQRLARALRDGETVLVHGDYDVDGVCGTALLVELFRLAGVRAQPYIPNRLSDGYSFGDHSVAEAQARGATVVVSVDNGTSAGATIEKLAARGIDTIVTDHHEAPLDPAHLPPAVAIVNPKLPGSSYPFRELCGAGVAFKLAWGLCQEISGARRVRADLRAFLSDAMAFVALATVCDVVPLIGENRVLARAGLRALEATQRPGLRALLARCGLDGRALRAEDVAFKIGPRLNAAGRLGSASRALDLLCCSDPTQAHNLALELDGLNEERRRIEAEILESALRAAEPYADAREHPVLVVAGQGWHQGVVGIVAARLVQRFSRPALVIGLDGAEGRGSARSVPGFNVLDAMRGGAQHMLRFGGHEQAAGCEVRADAVDALRTAVVACGREQSERCARNAVGLAIDAEISLEGMGPELMTHLDRLEPFGQDNAQPVLLSCDARLESPARVVGADRKHLMLHIRRGERVLKAMAFGAAARAPELGPGVPVHLVYSPRWNTFRGTTQLELLLHDFAVGARPLMGMREAGRA
jgi:single-stranded-DNA-specific exonuclease